MKKFLLCPSLALLTGGHVVPAQQNQPALGKDEDPPYNPDIINENNPGIDLAAPQDFHENFAP